MTPGDPTGQAARACGRGLTMPQPGTPLTVREAIAALDGGAHAYAHVSFMEDGIGREVELSAPALRTRLLKIDGDESTGFVLEDGDLILT